ncbi:TylF/MycF family methyltransferase [Halomicroarcula sp. S1AR25-4]|uniref:TylF/MycF/NovP-related O-methyltransferase n=1 Tax=Haloarcula sp. S1AR25-4 TaxID=2950538 RepID=UPI00287436D9|nr:TylF/MycF/NovP-related O-methyltransferase [Halomicroarcula sp. S1AR25-4]MDS0279056.1 TylF/MycF family methyltransferase [Halomicroarcula sp. S1AR25-4]
MKTVAEPAPSMDSVVVKDLADADEMAMTNEAQLSNHFHLLRQTLLADVPGDVVELGCFRGTSAVLFQRVLAHYAPARDLHVYDSFEGLPPKSEADGDAPLEEGFCYATVEELRDRFDAFDAAHPTVHEGWFEETLPEELPETIAYAHLDGDFYDSVLTSLEAVYPRLAEGAIVVVDDYVDPSVLDHHDILPGVKEACDEFFADRPEEVAVLACGENQAHGYVRKQ